MLRRFGEPDRVLIVSPARISAPSWRPDGSLVTFARVMGGSAQPLAICDPEGTFYALDTALAGLLGYEVADLIRMDWRRDLASADSRDRQSAALEELDRTGNPHDEFRSQLLHGRQALIVGTSHDLGQNFAKAFDVKFQDAEGRTST